MLKKIREEKTFNTTKKKDINEALNSLDERDEVLRELED
jgi:hypothetical protein